MVGDHAPTDLQSLGATAFSPTPTAALRHGRVYIASPLFRAHHRSASNERKNFAPPIRCFYPCPQNLSRGWVVILRGQDNSRVNQGQETTRLGPATGALRKSSGPKRRGRRGNPCAEASANQANSIPCSEIASVQGSSPGLQPESQGFLPFAPCASLCVPRGALKASQKLVSPPP